MGPAGSPAWHALLDGAEAILRDEGYAALTSRNIADRVGVNQQLLYYYFLTMDDLVVAAFRRAAEREMNTLNNAMDSNQPLREIWQACIHTQDSRLVAEFTALANHNDGLRKEVIAFIRETRRIQVQALTTALQRHKLPAIRLPARALIVIANSAALALARESALGITDGHAELESVIEEMLAAVEPAAGSNA
jgi:AcrR family transcriptional regulator